MPRPRAILLMGPTASKLEKVENYAKLNATDNALSDAFMNLLARH